MIDLILQGVSLISCGVIVWRAEPAIGHMTVKTHMAVRFAMWISTVGAVSRIGWIASGNVPDIITTFMLVGFASLIVCERRLRVLTGVRRRFDDPKEVR